MHIICHMPYSQVWIYVLKLKKNLLCKSGVVIQCSVYCTSGVEPCSSQCAGGPDRPAIPHSCPGSPVIRAIRPIPSPQPPRAVQYIIIQYNTAPSLSEVSITTPDHSVRSSISGNGFRRRLGTMGLYGPL